MARRPRYAFGCTGLSLVLFAMMTWAVFALEAVATLGLIESVMLMVCAGLPGAVFVASSGLLVAVCAADAARLLDARAARRGPPPAPRSMTALAAASATGGALSALGFGLLSGFVWSVAAPGEQVYTLRLYGLAGVSVFGAWRASRALFLGYRGLAWQGWMQTASDTLQVQQFLLYAQPGRRSLGELRRSGLDPVVAGLLDRWLPGWDR